MHVLLFSPLEEQIMFGTTMLAVLSTLAFSPQIGPNVAAAAKKTLPSKTASSKTASSKTTAPDASSTQKRSTPRSASDRVKRLPRFFGQLDLDPQQRAKIRALQAKCGQQQANLQRQIDKLESQLKKDLSKLLRTDQRRTLKKLERPKRTSKKR